MKKLIIAMIAVLLTNTASLAGKPVTPVINFILQESEPVSCPAVPVVTSSTGRVWMDRNLGATRIATHKTDSAAYGFLYQWGRLTDGHQERTSDVTDYNATSSVTTPGHPNFILALTDWLIPSNDNLWQGLNGINNPCPACFRLPTRAEWSAEMNTWAAENSTAAFDSPLKLVVAGTRNRDNGVLFGEGTHGFYWSEDIAGSPAYSYYFGFESSFAGVDTRLRAYGKSVRCIQQ